MSANEDLRRFVRDGLAGGTSRAELEAVRSVVEGRCDETVAAKQVDDVLMSRAA